MLHHAHVDNPCRKYIVPEREEALTITQLIVHNPMINILGVTIYYPTLRNGLVITCLLVILLVLSLLFSYLKRAFPEWFDPFIDDMRSLNITLPISFSDNEGYINEVDDISELLIEKSQDTGSSIQLSFWTPDESTWQSIRTHTQDNLWQKDISSKTLMLFMDTVLKLGDDSSMFKGFRNYHVCGKGSETFKCGTWWVTNTNQRFKLKEFIADYKAFWQNSPGIYLELSLNQNQYAH